MFCVVYGKKAGKSAHCVDALRSLGYHPDMNLDFFTHINPALQTWLHGTGRALPMEAHCGVQARTRGWNGARVQRLQDG